MPKMKTNKAASKRFRVTKNGKVMYVHAGLRHNLEGKSADRKRVMSQDETLSEPAAREVKRLLGLR